VKRQQRLILGNGVDTRGKISQNRYPNPQRVFDARYDGDFDRADGCLGRQFPAAPFLDSRTDIQ